MRGRKPALAGRHSRGFSTSVVMAMALFAVAALAVAWMYHGMVTQDRWPIRWLEVDGVFQRVSAERVRIKAAPLVSGSFFTVDLRAVHEQTAQLPWVAAVTVQKNWPDTVRIVVREHSPAAHWTDGRLIAPGGLVFRVPAADEMQGLPWLEGPEGTLDEVFAQWRQINQDLMPVGLEIRRIRLDRRGAWFLELDNGSRVHLGREDTVQRVRRLVSSWPALQRIKDVAPTDLDLRYSNGLAVRWPEPPPQMAAHNPG